MGENKETYYSLGELMNNLSLAFRFLIRRWWVFLLAVGAGAAVGFLLYGRQKPKYAAASTFIVEEKQNSMGGLSSIASQFGFDIGGASGGGSIFSGDNILDILESGKIVRQVLLSKVDNSSGSPSLADLYLDFSGLREKWKSRPELASIRFSDSAASQTVLGDSVLNIIHELITKKNIDASRINKKGTIVRVEVNSANGLFSRLMTERLVDAASMMYLNIKTGTAQENIHRMQRRSDSLLALLNNKSYTAMAVQPLDVNPGIRTAIVPSEIALRDKTVIATLYTEVTKNLEASKLLLSQQTPVIQILDRPGLSLFDNKKSLTFHLALYGMIGFTLSFFGLVILYFVKTIRR